MASNKKSKLARQQAASKARREQRQDGASTASSAKAAVPRQTKAEAKKKGRDTLVKVAAVVFAAIMAFSMMLPSCSAIFAGNTTTQQATDATADGTGDTSGDESSTDAATADESEELTGIALANSQYQPLVDELKAKLEQDEDDLASILNLGYYYMDWATQASYSATTDEDTLYVYGLYDQAVEYFDRYLELNDSKEVRTRRALCMFYAGDTYEAIAALEEFTATTPDYAPAWVYLGMMYESTGRSDDAEAAYMKVTETDPDDTYGLRSYVTERIAALNADATDTSTSTGSSSDAGTSLRDALSSGSGTSY